MPTKIFIIIAKLKMEYRSWEYDFWLSDSPLGQLSIKSKKESLFLNFSEKYFTRGTKLKQNKQTNQTNRLTTDHFLKLPNLNTFLFICLSVTEFLSSEFGEIEFLYFKFHNLGYSSYSYDVSLQN